MSLLSIFWCLFLLFHVLLKKIPQELIPSCLIINCNSKINKSELNSWTKLYRFCKIDCIQLAEGNKLRPAMNCNTLTTTTTTTAQFTSSSAALQNSIICSSPSPLSVFYLYSVPHPPPLLHCLPVQVKLSFTA